MKRTECWDHSVTPPHTICVRHTRTRTCGPRLSRTLRQHLIRFTPVRRSPCSRDVTRSEVRGIAAHSVATWFFPGKSVQIEAHQAHLLARTLSDGTSLLGLDRLIMEASESSPAGSRARFPITRGLRFALQGQSRRMHRQVRPRSAVSEKIGRIDPRFFLIDAAIKVPNYLPTRMQAAKAPVHPLPHGRTSRT